MQLRRGDVDDSHEVERCALLLDRVEPVTPLADLGSRRVDAERRAHRRLERELLESSDVRAVKTIVDVAYVGRAHAHAFFYARDVEARLYELKAVHRREHSKRAEDDDRDEETERYFLRTTHFPALILPLHTILLSIGTIGNSCERENLADKKGPAVRRGLRITARELIYSFAS